MGTGSPYCDSPASLGDVSLLGSKRIALRNVALQSRKSMLMMQHWILRVEGFIVCPSLSSFNISLKTRFEPEEEDEEEAEPPALSV
jgi:hypothetical protein